MTLAYVQTRSADPTERHHRPLSADGAARPRALGKFLFVGEHKLYVRGATYGTFRPDGRGHRFPRPPIVARDFAAMAANGLNAVRTYTAPPVWLLDLAERHRLRVMVGLPWEQHVAFLDDRAISRGIEQRIRAGVWRTAGHPAVLCYAIGNEIPASIVRWTGRRRTERFLRRLYDAAKETDPGALVTYANYPSTEYLRLPFLDLVCMNVYLESIPELARYLARLQNLAGDRPLMVGELGMDSRRNGPLAQARLLGQQIRTSFGAGCAGAFVFSWTDEWHRGESDVLDWDFGLTTRARKPKPSLHSTRRAFAETPAAAACRPRISVVVCVHNARSTIRECLDGLLRLEYPDFEVIVVDDGSTDGTADLVADYPVRLIRTSNQGLSAARNTGIRAASGEVVAFTDGDAWPDPSWLDYMAVTLAETEYAGVGGPNLQPTGDPWLAECVANSPGGPVHVLISDREAEHLPGCNMAFRREALEAVGGFDPRFRAAGDDVDLCWRLLDHGYRLGYSPAAVVWHHHRGSVRAFWRQQWGYGRAEALLEEKWPDKYNAAGQARWGGRVYGRSGWLRDRVYHGTWGLAGYQTLERRPALLLSLATAPEWTLLILVLLALASLGALWTPLLLAVPAAALAAGAAVASAVRGAAAARFHEAERPWAARIRMRALTAVLHLIQPVARLGGRLSEGLTPWRPRGRRLSWPAPRRFTVWSEAWRSLEQRLRSLERTARAAGVPTRRGGCYDRWDLELRGGTLGAVRLSTGLEEHGQGRQLIRFRLVPLATRWGAALALSLATVAALALVDDATAVAALFGAAAGLTLARVGLDAARATAAALDMGPLVDEARAETEAGAIALERPGPERRELRSVGQALREVG